MLLLGCMDCGSTYFSAASAGTCPDCGADLEAGPPAGRSLLDAYEDAHNGHHRNVNGGHKTEFDRLWSALLGDELHAEEGERLHEHRRSA